jgi:magnesium-transporting ATPase (P-type)
MMRVTGVGYNATDGHVTTTSEKEMTGIAVGISEHPGAARVLITGAICNNASVRVNVTEEEVKEGRMGSTTDGRVIPGGLGRTEHGVTVVGLPTEAALLVGAAKMGLGDPRLLMTRTSEMPFSSERKMMAVRCTRGARDSVGGFRGGEGDGGGQGGEQGGGGGEVLAGLGFPVDCVFLKGALENVISRCSLIDRGGGGGGGGGTEGGAEGGGGGGGGGSEQLCAHHIEAIREAALGEERQGRRVVAMAHADARTMHGSDGGSSRGVMGVMTAMQSTMPELYGLTFDGFVGTTCLFEWFYWFKGKGVCECWGGFVLCLVPPSFFL